MLSEKKETRKHKTSANIVFLSLCTLPFFCSWGFFAHKKINHYAIFTLPKELASFYKPHITYVTEHAVDPDRRRSVLAGESERHYIDLDRYGKSPFDTLSPSWAKAVESYGEDNLRDNGILPWQIQKSYRLLVYAFSQQDSESILKLSADLGHYIADAHVPLHTTSNYNGQQTDQEGIHAFWESRLPEVFASRYNFAVGKAQYIENSQDEAWKIVKNTYSLVDSVLEIEKKLSKQYKQGQKYRYEKRNQQLVRAYSAPFSKAYHKALNGMVERQMRAAIISIGSYWYSAWIDAGQPNLPVHKGTLATDTVQSPTAGKKIPGREEWH